MIRRGDQWRLIWRKLGLRRKRAAFVVVLVALGTLAPVAVSSLARGIQALALDTAGTDALHPDVIEVRVKYDPYEATRSDDEQRALAKRRRTFLSEAVLEEFRRWPQVEAAAESIGVQPVSVPQWSNLVGRVTNWTGVPRALLGRYGAKEPLAEPRVIPVVVGRRAIRRWWDPAAGKTRTWSAAELDKAWTGREITLVVGDPFAGLSAFRYDENAKDFRPLAPAAAAQNRRQYEEMLRGGQDLALGSATIALRARVVGLSDGSEAYLPADVAAQCRRWLQQREQLASLRPLRGTGEPRFESGGRITPRAGEFTEARVVVRDRLTIEGVAKKIEGLGFFAATHDRSFEHQVRAFESFFKVLRRGTLAFAGVILGLAGALLWSTTAKIVADSRPDIGLYRALGATKADIRRLFLGESVLLGLLGTMVGVGLGWLAAWGVGVAILRFTKQELAEADELFNLPDSVFRVDWMFCLLLLVAAMAVAFLAGLWPAQRAANIDPVKALRRE